ncbi:cell division protein FtsW (lipid II flippase) [Paenibacillus anaericanus]|uniref:FtsW/RodA/SpoVE family cell cycle protein n=1 Tax=Paenibacillus anaericanus TaxID=170367 RepID=UPI0027840F7F|nr:FtsW/RodA/SpoVE family cell cycle protein [Paenibacillus anaericanus]MDQ0089537.1 cell division protein FtsW (lipid II flippase) [Paenibacillus anaericanus]
MRQFEDNKVVQNYLDRVCRHVRAKQLHSEIREELSSHIAERMEILLLEGIPEQFAAEEVISQMGSPDSIGQSLHQAHKPQMEWRLFVILGLLAIIGLLAAFNVQNSESVPKHVTNLFEKKAMFTGIGLLGLACVYFIDYRKLKPYSEAIFLSVLCLMALTLTTGSTINGSRAFLSIGSMGINTMMLSLLPLLIALAGMKPANQWGRIESIIQLVYRGILPVVLYSMGDSMVFGLIYLCGFFVLTWRTKKSLRQYLVFGVSFMTFFIFMLTRSIDQILHRLQAFFNPVDESSYQMIQMVRAIRSAGWSGHGFASLNETLPHIYSDSLFAYLIYCFGWGFGILVVLLVILFLSCLWNMTASVKDDYAKRITVVFIIVFGFRLLWPILMSFGIVPIVGLELPFIGNGVMTIFDFAAVGLLLSIYRCKNILPSAICD